MELVFGTVTGLPGIGRIRRCGVGVLIGDRAWDSLLAASVLPLGNGEDPKGKVKRVLLPPASGNSPIPLLTTYADFHKIQIRGGW